MASGFELLIVMLFAFSFGGFFVAWVLKRRGERPYAACGACRYNVTGSIGKVDRCPECGALFTDVGITPPGRAQSRRVVIAAVVCTAIVGGTCLTGSLIATAAIAREGAAARQAAAAQAAARAQAIAAQAEATARTAAEIDRMVHDLPREEAIVRLRERLDAEQDPSIKAILERVLDHLETLESDAVTNPDGAP